MRCDADCGGGVPYSYNDEAQGRKKRTTGQGRKRCRMEQKGGSAVIKLAQGRTGAMLK